ncbi:MAG: DEAD/DEAH box helicase, partial [Bdellovibrionales bacterium]|nr:DEAD/DEAH box helicase [Bdellovibrionales bacterium]
MHFSSPHSRSSLFSDLSLAEPLLRKLPEDYIRPTEIQARAIPVVYNGEDVILGSETGSGKTAAFVLPILSRIQEKESHHRGPHTLVLSPTRDLALQTGKVFETFNTSKHTQIVNCFGGLNSDRIVSDLSEADTCQIVTGTLGTVASLVRKGHLKLHNLKSLIFDEADLLLNGEERRRVGSIVAACPASRQTLMVSASLRYLPQSAYQYFAKQPIEIHCQTLQIPNHIEHILFETNHIRQKFSVLMHVLQTTEMQKAIIFLNARSWTNSCYQAMLRLGLGAT